MGIDGIYWGREWFIQGEQELDLTPERLLHHCWIWIVGAFKGKGSIWLKID
jgi:hypothetical protein